MEIVKKRGWLPRWIQQDSRESQGASEVANSRAQCRETAWHRTHL
jgi:hypothetical protein